MHRQASEPWTPRTCHRCRKGMTERSSGPHAFPPDPRYDGESLHDCDGHYCNGFQVALGQPIFVTTPRWHGRVSQLGCKPTLSQRTQREFMSQYLRLPSFLVGKKT
eukprot:XP_001710147.1 Hypothetical protein GL50803_31542 [Giardia lamblia ATCC 50803]